MILGIGNDLVDIRRIKNALHRHGSRFEERIFTSYEQQKSHARKACSANREAQAEYYAKRFAAKEAAAKALGTGFRDGLYFKHIGVKEDQSGRPVLHMSEAALQQLKTITPDGYKAVLHLSLSDDPPYAQAFVVIEARPIMS